MLNTLIGLGGLGLNYMGMKNAGNAQKQALMAQAAEQRKREMLQKLYLDNELSRLGADRGLQELSLDQIRNLNEGEEKEILPLKEQFYKDIDPYMKEQKLYLQDPIAWQRQQDELLMNSPYATRGREGEGQAYMAAKTNRNVPSSIYRDAAGESWKNAISGFTNDRKAKQREALEGIASGYQNKAGDVQRKYGTRRQQVNDLLNAALGNSNRMGEVSANALGLGTGSSRERGDLGNSIALLKGEAGSAKNAFLQDLFRVPEGNVEGYENPQEFLMDKYISSKVDLQPSDAKILEQLRKLKGKNKRFSLLDYLNNIGADANAK